MALRARAALGPSLRLVPLRLAPTVDKPNPGPEEITMITFTTVKAALAWAKPTTRCTVCTREARSGFANTSAGNACVARIHDAFSTDNTEESVLRRKLVANFKARRSTGVPGAGMIDR